MYIPVEESLTPIRGSSTGFYFLSFLDKFRGQVVNEIRNGFISNTFFVKEPCLLNSTYDFNTK